MKFLIVALSALAIASASFIPHSVAVATPVVASPVYPGPQHLPVIGPNGVPVDTPSVQKAKAEHFVHKAVAHARNGDIAVAAVPAIAPVATPIAAPIAAPIATPVVSGPVAVSGPVHAYPTTVGVPAVTANGVPLDTPEVAAAKANHFAAYAATWHSRARRAVVYPTAYGYTGYTGYTGFTGYPLTTPYRYFY